MAQRQQTAKEETVNVITHGMGILFCLIAAPLIISSALASGSATMLWGVSIFCVGMFMVYTSSTVFHAFQHTRAGEKLEILDHISIFLLIAGTYTPIVLKYTPRATAFTFLGFMWGMVAIGSILKLFFTGKYEIISLALYIGMGWMAVFIFKPIMANMPPYIFWCIVAGGLSYTIGIIFFVWRQLKYAHAVWHLLVLNGTVIHFFAVYYSIAVIVKV